MDNFGDSQQQNTGGDLNFDNNEDFFNQNSGGIQMNSMGGGGFQPAMGMNSVDDDLTEEERALVQKVQQQAEDRKRALYEK